MKNVKFTATLLAVASLFSLVSCSDDSEGKSRMVLLTQKTWKLVSAAPAATPTATIPLDNCAKDDVYTFTTAGTFTLDEGPTKCDPGDPQTETGTWVFSSNETIITVTVNGDAVPQEILELSETTLKAKMTIPGTTTSVIQTLGH